MTLAELQAATLARLGDVPGSAQTHYTPHEATVALNRVYRLMVFLTLCLEANTTFTWTGAAATMEMLSLFADWILPLRLRIPSGAKIKPNTFAAMAALNEQWSVTAGTPERYALGGFSLIGLYKQPATDTAIAVTYARMPAPLFLATDVPELQPEYHQSLIDGALPVLRIKEGAQEWQKTLPLWDRYLGAAQKLGQYVRARNKERGYDYMPPDLTRFDKSKLLKAAV